MIKCMLLMRRAPHLSHEDFIAHWAGRHADLALSHADGVVRYAQNHARSHPIVQATAEVRGCAIGDYDGVAEAWYESFEALIEAGAHLPEGFAEAVLADEREFIDLARSTIWFGEEIVRKS
jgi:hypothetical protein